MMAGFSLARAWTPAVSRELSRSARMTVIGAVFFMTSDSLPAWDRFAGGVPVPALLVLSSDWLAQWCSARSAQRD
jgi:Na+/citrate or Na+/malate symporter